MRELFAMLEANQIHVSLNQWHQKKLNTFPFEGSILSAVNLLQYEEPNSRFEPFS